MSRAFLGNYQSLLTLRFFQLRDCWDCKACLTFGLRLLILILAFVTTHNGLIQAEAKGLGVKRDEVSMMTPCFLAEVDVQAGAVNSSTAVWGQTTWASGHYAVNPPEAAGKISSYDVLDQLVEYYTDILRFPNMRVSSSSMQYRPSNGTLTT